MSDNKASIERIGKRLRAARRARHLTQAEVAKKAGINESHYAQIERGEKNPSATYLLKVIEVIGVESKDILGK